MVDPESQLSDPCRDGDIDWVLIPYQKPGRDLAQAISEHPQFGKCAIFILQNHGLVVCANTPEEAQAITLDVIQKTSRAARQDRTDLSRISKVQAMMGRAGYKLPSNPLIHSLACNPSSLEYFGRENNVLYPDQAVFLGKNAVIMSDVEKNTPPVNAPFIVIPNVGVFINQAASVMVEAMLLCHAEVLARVPADAHMNYLSDSDVAELTNWDAEKYRQSIN